MKFCYNMRFTLSQQSQRSRSILKDGSRFLGLFWKKKTLSYKQRNLVFYNNFYQFSIRTCYELLEPHHWDSSDEGWQCKFFCVFFLWANKIYPKLITKYLIWVSDTSSYRYHKFMFFIIKTTSYDLFKSDKVAIFKFINSFPLSYSITPMRQRA